MGDRIDLAAIRQRHAQWHDANDDSPAMDEDEWDAYALAVIEDRDVLLAMVDRLTGENDVLRIEIANITASKRAQP